MHQEYTQYSAADDSGIFSLTLPSTPDKSSGSVCVSPRESPLRSQFTFDSAHAAVRAMPVILENGRKVFGPPANYSGPRPSYVCELYITHVPTDLDELGLLVWLHRCGVVFEFRLMMDTGEKTRGYAFVRYTLEEEALAAYELLNFLYVNRERLKVYRSQGKNRLYVNNIPKQMPMAALEAGFRKAFPEMQNCNIYPAKESGGDERNRGFAFIEFLDHENALEAKKRTTPGRVRMWDCDLKVQWAKPKLQQATAKAIGSFEGYKILEQSQQQRSFPVWHLQNDYCAKLRLHCLANNWCIPIVIYGRNFHHYHVQYGGILLKNAFTGECSYIIMEVNVIHVSDIHVLMCEVALHLLERSAGLPKLHYILRVVNGVRAEILHSFTNISTLKSANIDHYFINANSVYGLATSMQILTQYSSEAILNCYKRSFLNANTDVPTMHLNVEQPYAKFYSIFPKFRNNPPLNNNFNNTEITLLQAAVESADAVANNYCTMASSIYNGQHFRLKSQRINLHFNYILRYVDVDKVETCGFYHPAQQINSHPIWISGHTYQKSIFKM